jgi:hypothetical protein
MVVDDADISRSSFKPVKTDAPLIIDANAVLPCAVAFQQLKPVAWRNAKVIHDNRLIKQAQLSQRNGLYIGRQFAASPAVPDQLCLRVSKISDQGSI